MTKSTGSFEEMACQICLNILGVSLGARHLQTEHLEKICPLFQKQDSIIKDIINQINRVDGLTEKTRFTEKLQKGINALLACPDFAGNKTDCKNCHCIANLRKKTADLMIKVKKLG